MRRALASLGVLAATACVPDLDVKASRIVEPRVVAVRATPAEALPGDLVSWEAILVTPLPAAERTQIDWAFCNAPRSPSDSITVSSACLAPVDTVSPAPIVQQIPGASGPFAQGTIPRDICRKIGPEVPLTNEMGDAQRPPDADITGGYQLPIRLVTSDPIGIKDIAFDRQRVRCDLANAPSDAAREYQMRYRANQNPSFDAIVFANNQAAADGTARFGAPRGQKLSIRVLWNPAVAETYVLFDPAARAIQERTERLEIGWFTNGGSFERDRTTPDDAQSTSNELTLDEDLHEVATVWIVLRDERGGVGVATMTLVPN